MVLCALVRGFCNLLSYLQMHRDQDGILPLMFFIPPALSLLAPDNFFSLLLEIISFCFLFFILKQRNALVISWRPTKSGVESAAANLGFKSNLSFSISRWITKKKEECSM